MSTVDSESTPPTASAGAGEAHDIAFAARLGDHPANWLT